MGAGSIKLSKRCGCRSIRIQAGIRRANPLARTDSSDWNPAPLDRPGAISFTKNSSCGGGASEEETRRAGSITLGVSGIRLSFDSANSAGRPEAERVKNGRYEECGSGQETANGKSSTTKAAYEYCNSAKVFKSISACEEAPSRDNSATMMLSLYYFKLRAHTESSTFCAPRRSSAAIRAV